LAQEIVAEQMKGRWQISHILLSCVTVGAAGVLKGAFDPRLSL